MPPFSHPPLWATTAGGSRSPPLGATLAFSSMPAHTGSKQSSDKYRRTSHGELGPRPPWRAASLPSPSCSARFDYVVNALAELLDDLRAERGQVVGLAAGDQAPVDDHLLVHPIAAGIANIGLQRGP